MGRDLARAAFVLITLTGCSAPFAAEDALLPDAGSDDRQTAPRTDSNSSASQADSGQSQESQDPSADADAAKNERETSVGPWVDSGDMSASDSGNESVGADGAGLPQRDSGSGGGGSQDAGIALDAATDADRSDSAKDTGSDPPDVVLCTEPGMKECSGECVEESPDNGCSEKWVGSCSYSCSQFIGPLEQHELYACGGADNTCVTECVSGYKRCDGDCVFASAAIGCDSRHCSPCPDPPQYGISVCDGSTGTRTCSFVCKNGFVRSGDSCVPD